MKKAAPQKKASSAGTEEHYVLELINDDVNTFDYVITALVEICGHDPLQAEQCALITHFKGSCDVKMGQKEMLTSMKRSIGKRGLIAKVERVL